jgi:hypothetical protein
MHEFRGRRLRQRRSGILRRPGVSAIASDVRLEQLTADADACGPEARALFDRLIAEGKTPEAAAMYACQQAPGTKNTDRAFSQGQQRKMENMSPLVRGMLQDRARKAGIDSRGKYYVGGLADRGKGPSDPSAWVTCAEDVLTVCKAKNLQCDGVLNRQAVKKDQPKKEIGLAPDIVRNIERKMLRADPALRARVQKNKHARRELHEQIVEKHSRKKRPMKANRLLRSKQ